MDRKIKEVIKTSKLGLKDFFSDMTLKKLVWFAPLVYLAHIIEEATFGFFNFVNKYQGTHATLVDFLIGNGILMIGYILIITLFTFYPNRFTAFISLSLLLAAQFFNAFFHLIATIRYGEYCPGLITGFALYIPFNIYVVWKGYQEEYITKTTAAICFVLGAILMTLFEIQPIILILVVGITIVIALPIYYIISRKSN